MEIQAHTGMPKCCWLTFYSFLFIEFLGGGGLSTTQFQNKSHVWSLMFAYKCPALDWLFSSQVFLNLNEPIYLLPLCFSFSYLCSLSFTHTPQVALWLCDWPFLFSCLDVSAFRSFSPSSLFLFILSVCQTHLSFFSFLVIGHLVLYYAIRCLKQAKNSSFTELN